MGLGKAAFRKIGIFEMRALIDTNLKNLLDLTTVVEFIITE